MILVRNTFNLKFGKAKEAKALLKEGMEIMKKLGLENGRALTDLTGKAYRLILESSYNSLADLENTLKNAFGNKDWENWYQKFVPLVDSSEREILTIVD